MDKKENLARILFSTEGKLILLFLLITLLINILILTSGLLTPTLDFIKSMLFEQKTAQHSSMIVLTKLFSWLIIFGLIIFIYSILSGIESFDTYKKATRNYQINEPDLNTVIHKSLRWNLYRIGYVLSPPAAIIGIWMLLFLFTLYFFNFIITIAGISLEIFTFIVTYINVVLALGFLLSIFLSIYNLLTTLFGIECAVSEPHLSNVLIRKRSERLSKISNIYLYLSYLTILTSLIIQGLIITSIKSSSGIENLIIIMLIIAFDVICLKGLGYYKATLYIDSLTTHYKKITMQS